MEPISQVAQLVRERVSEFARTFGRFTMREKGYTTFLLGRLEQQLPLRVFAPSGAMIKDVQPHLTDDQRQRASVLRNANDYYPDVLITERPLSDLPGGNMRQLEAVVPLRPAVLLELKFHSSYETIQRHNVVPDPIKLEMLGHYLRSLTGVKPHLEFYFFNFANGRGRVKDSKTVHNWLRYAKERAPDVVCSWVSMDGEIRQVEA